MKKSLFITIAILVIASVLCFAAFAEDGPITSISSNNSRSTDVKASLSSNSDEPVYCVTVEFDDMEFTYCNIWDPDADRGPAYSSEWTSSSNKIIVTNKSNVDVNINFSYEKGSNFEAIDFDFAKGEYKNNKWEQTTQSFTPGYQNLLGKYNSTEKAWTLCAFLNLSGNTDKLDEEDTSTIGTVTVTASAVE